MNHKNPVELTKKLIEIPSISRQETEIPEYIASLVDGEIQEFRCRGRECGKNVIAISEPEPGRPFILLNGHHDTIGGYFQITVRAVSVGKGKRDVDFNKFV